jgi:DnaJ-class molecular chaperone
MQPQPCEGAWKCGWCHGSGYNGEKEPVCGGCNGKGWILPTAKVAEPSPTASSEDAPLVEDRLL